MKNNNIQSEDNINQKSTILGKYEGECADANITNKNGLDITREVWENVFDSEDYKQAIDLGWYIGFLGHPEDPNCMDFEHACIIMREGHIDDNSKVYGSFDLIDTPVGRIVKAFQDAGVQFGISVRGAGDIIDNSVDPDTFIFRGFDLVSFPAYPDAIPKFTEIAASTNIDDQQKYKTICAAVNDNIDSLNTKESIDIVQSQFAKQSDEYKVLENRKKEIQSSVDELINIDSEKIEALTQLYIEAQKNIDTLRDENEKLRIAASSAISNAERKINSLKRIQSDQLDNCRKTSDIAEHKKVLANITIERLKNELKESNKKCKQLEDKNLKYKRKVESADENIKNKDRIISELDSKLNETVVSSEELEKKATNLAVKVQRLESKIDASQQIIQEYQDAYGDMYANALGVHIDNMSITANTSVEDLKSIIKSRVSKDNLSNTLTKNYSDEEIYVNTQDDENDIITL